MRNQTTAVYARVLAAPLLIVFLLLAEQIVQPKNADAALSQRSVRINTYNTWHYVASDPTDDSNKFNIVASSDNVVYSEYWDIFGITPADIKAAQPGTMVYRVYILSAKPTFDPDFTNPYDTSRMITPLTKDEIDQHDWWLRDGNGDIAIYPDGAWSLDVGKPGFKEAYLDALLPRLYGRGFDGVVFDYWAGYLPLSLDGKPLPPQYQTDQDWMEKAWKPFITYVMAGVRNAGYRIIGNGGSSGWNIPGVDWQRTQVDGVIYEQWAVGWQDEWLPASTIAARMQAFNQDPLEAWTADYGLRNNDPEYVRKYTVGLAMYYLSIPASQDNRSYHHYHDGNIFWLPLWDFYIGVPAGSTAKSSGSYFWSRKFTKGLVLMNYEQTKSVRFSIKGRYRTMSGQIVSGKITIKPHTAYILSSV